MYTRARTHVCVCVCVCAAAAAAAARARAGGHILHRDVCALVRIQVLSFGKPTTVAAFFRDSPEKVCRLFDIVSEWLL